MGTASLAKGSIGGPKKEALSILSQSDEKRPHRSI